MEATGRNGHDEASKNGNDKECDLDGRDVFLGLVECFDVVLLAVPLGQVKAVGVNDNLSVLVVLAGKDIFNKVAHLLFVRLLLGRL